MLVLSTGAFEVSPTSTVIVLSDTVHVKEFPNSSSAPQTFYMPRPTG